MGIYFTLNEGNHEILVAGGNLDEAKQLKFETPPKPNRQNESSLRNPLALRALTKYKTLHGATEAMEAISVG